jgi:hypothetical protein
MGDQIITEIGEDYALATDGLQWIVCKRRKGTKSGWRPVAFISTTKAVLARCMREAGVPQIVAGHVLATLPGTFKEWSRQQVATAGKMVGGGVEDPQTVMAHVAIHEVRL